MASIRSLEPTLAENVPLNKARINIPANEVTRRLIEARLAATDLLSRIEIVDIERFANECTGHPSVEARSQTARRSADRLSTGFVFP